MLFFFYTFEADYPFNYNRLLLRNNLLHWVVADPWRKLAFGLCAAYAALSIAVTELKREHLFLLYPLALLYLLPSWVIEPRYLIAPLVLFNIFRKPRRPQVEFALVILFIAAALYIFFGYQGNSFIL